jgi:hypothetical protein
MHTGQVEMKDGDRMLLKRRASIERMRKSVMLETPT